MPQLDKVSFLSQFVWFLICFLTFYTLLVKNYLPVIQRIKLSREYVIRQPRVTLHYAYFYWNLYANSYIGGAFDSKHDSKLEVTWEKMGSKLFASPQKTTATTSSKLIQSYIQWISNWFDSLFDTIYHGITYNYSLLYYIAVDKIAKMNYFQLFQISGSKVKVLRKSLVNNVGLKKKLKLMK